MNEGGGAGGPMRGWKIVEQICKLNKGDRHPRKKRAKKEWGVG